MWLAREWITAPFLLSADLMVSKILVSAAHRSLGGRLLRYSIMSRLVMALVWMAVARVVPSGHLASRAVCVSSQATSILSLFMSFEGASAKIRVDSG